jgi:hypothetical protein
LNWFIRKKSQTEAYVTGNSSQCDYFEGIVVAGWATLSAKDFSSDGTQISSTNSSFGRSFMIL